MPWNILLDNSWISIVRIKHDRRKPLLRSLGLDMFTSFPFCLRRIIPHLQLLGRKKVSSMQNHRQNHLSIAFILYTYPLNPIRPEKQGQIYIDANPT